MREGPFSLNKRNAKTELRRQMKKTRAALSLEDRLAASRMTCSRVARSSVFMAAANLGIYYSVRGELDITPLQHLAWSSGKKVFLPIIFAGHSPKMEFAEIRPDTPLISNGFGIPEPAPSRISLIDPRLLDLVLTPLVAFDKYGHRIGMGAGYYDRCFRFLSRARAWRKPKLVGVAYSFQEVPSIEPQPWDIPLSGMATEEAMRTPHRKPAQDRRKP